MKKLLTILAAMLLLGCEKELPVNSADFLVRTVTAKGIVLVDTVRIKKATGSLSWGENIDDNGVATIRVSFADGSRFSVVNGAITARRIVIAEGK